MKPEELTIEDIARTCHRVGVHVNWLILPAGYPRRFHTYRGYLRQMTPAIVSLIQRGYRREGLFTRHAVPFSGHFEAVKIGMAMKRLRKAKGLA